jgi:capsule polysaccharide modification protein KpsS
MLPKILFFSRDYQSNLFPHLSSEKYDSIYVTLNKKEKKNVEKHGGKVVGCLEEDLPKCREKEIIFPYLDTSLSTDRFLNQFDHETRIKLLKKLVYFWGSILDEYEPMAVVNEPIAIEVSEILWIESNKRSIRYLALGSFYIPNTFYFLPSPNLSSSFREIIKSLKPDDGFELAKNQFFKIKNKIHPDYAKVLNNRNSPIRLYKVLKRLMAEQNKRLYSNSKLIRKLCYGDSTNYFINDLKNYFRSLFLSSNYYTNISSIIDKKFLFFPIHFEPEAVISYGAYFNSEQDIFIHNILKSLREDQILVVKEHPQQLSILTESRFKRLKNLWPNLHYVKGEFSSFMLLEKAEIVITLGGTAGFEALVHGKDVINFGSNYYDSYSGILNFSNFKDLRDFFRNDKTFPPKSDFLIYMSKVFSTLYPGDPWPNENLYKNENISNIVRSIENELGL